MSLKSASASAATTRPVMWSADHRFWHSGGKRTPPRDHITACDRGASLFDVRLGPGEIVLAQCFEVGDGDGKRLVDRCKVPGGDLRLQPLQLFLGSETFMQPAY